jgi:hypothetical protein
MQQGCCSHYGEQSRNTDNSLYVTIVSVLSVCWFVHYTTELHFKLDTLCVRARACVYTCCKCDFVSSHYRSIRQYFFGNILHKAVMKLQVIQRHTSQTSKWAALQFTECQNTHFLLLIVETLNVHQQQASRLQTRPFPVRNR